MKTTRGKATKLEREALKPVDDRKVGKRKAAAPTQTVRSGKRKAVKKGIAKKDPNKPKRPPTAFFVFLEEFRITFKKENPNVKAVSAVGKAGGEKWKSLSQAEKAPYEAKAAKKKADYQKQVDAYNNDQEKDESGEAEDEEEEDEDEDEDED